MERAGGTFNDVDGTLAAILENADELAAILIEAPLTNVAPFVATFQITDLGNRSVSQ